MPRKPKQSAEEPTPSTPATNGKENIAGYFRKVFDENPRLLKQRSNDALYKRWLADHPGYTEVPKSVRTGLQNIKSVLRSQMKSRRGRRATQTEEGAPVETAPVKQGRPKSAGRSLERLEGMIDECLFEARGLETAELEKVLVFLRQARNEVIRQGNTRA